MRNSQNKKSLFSIFSRVCFKSKLSFWLFLFIFIFSCSNALAWTPPQSPPPQDNVPQPLNTGPTAQGKIGNLGIGTTTPSYLLDVSGEVRFTHLLTGTAFYSGIYFLNPASGTLSLDVLGSIRAIGTTNDNYLAGNLGIGIAAPDGKLEIRQTGSDDIFNLYDNTTNVLTVLDGGNVGIGISAPTGLLDVNNRFIVTDEQITMNVPLNLAAAGDISIASDLQFTSPTASYIKSYAPLYLQAGDSNHSYDLTLRAFNSGEVVSDAQMNLSNNRITNLATPIDDADAATKGYVDGIDYWQVTDSYLYPTSMDYAVGIGTTAPSVDLQIHDSGNASELLLSSDADKKSMIYFEDGQTGIYEPANSEDLRFWTNNTDQMTITSDGNVGIGTTSPGALLEISGNSDQFKINGDISAIMRIDKNGANTQSTIKFTTADAENWNIGTTDSDTAGYDGDEFYIGQTAAGLNPTVLINPNGNVGIGTDSPDNKLSVSGDANITGNVGIGTTSPDYSLTVVTEVGETSFVKMYGNGVSEDDGVFTISNYTGSNGVFAPVFYGKTNSNSFPGVTFIAQGESDTGDVPLMRFQSRVGSTVNTRPILTFENGMVKVM